MVRKIESTCIFGVYERTLAEKPGVVPPIQ
jgi:hypothetical protein